jgi:hypothetical protein
MKDLSLHSLTLSLAFLGLLGAIVGLLATSAAVPAELWTVFGTIAGVVLGVAVPSPAQTATNTQLMSMMDRHTDALTALANMPSRPAPVGPTYSA